MQENKELRAVYNEILIELAKKDPRIVTIDSDLSRAAGILAFKKEFPERWFDVGVAEANMVGLAAGLAAMGKIPFVHTFTPFITRRCFDQITISIMYAGLNAKFIGSDPGLSAEINGGTHMSIDDINIMRAVPELAIVEPVDSAAMKSLLPQIAAYEKSVYMRLFRKKADMVYEDAPNLKIGKASVVKEGKDCAVIASGIMVFNSLEAAKALEKDGISVKVIDMHTIKPLDCDEIIKSAKDCGKILTVENHTIIGGLGSAVAECIADNNLNVKFGRMGMLDRYGEVGFRPYLQEAFKLTVDDIVGNVKALLK